MDDGAKVGGLAALIPFLASRYYRNNYLRGYDQSSFRSVFGRLFRRRFLNDKRPVRVRNNDGRLFSGSRITDSLCLRIVSTHNRSRRGAGCQNAKDP